MDISGSQESKAHMVVLVLVPVEELRKEAPRLVDGRKSLGEVSSVLEGLELGFREGVVIGSVGTRVTLLYAEVCEERKLCYERP